MSALFTARVAWVFYRQSRDISHFLQSNDSVSHNSYMRILALASIDVLTTLPVGIVSIALQVTRSLSIAPMPFYSGWAYDHSNWEPLGVSYEEMLANGTSVVSRQYFTQWTSPFLAFIIFGLFGITSEARASYWRIICTMGGWFCRNRMPPREHRARSPLGDIEFGERPPQDMSLGIE